MAPAMLILPVEKRISEMLQKQQPMRIAVFLRRKSPLYHLESGTDEVVAQACSTLGIDPVASRARLMTALKWHRITIFAFNVWYDDYDWATAHHQVDLPVILVDYGKRLSFVKVASKEFCDEVNEFVASQHRKHGWDEKPPYRQDQTIPGVVPTYKSPRDMIFQGRQWVKTPPPGSVCAYPPYTEGTPRPQFPKSLETEEAKAQSPGTDAKERGGGELGISVS